MMSFLIYAMDSSNFLHVRKKLNLVFSENPDYLDNSNVEEDSKKYASNTKSEEMKE